MYILPFIGENCYVYTRKYQNYLQEKSSDSAMEPDDFTILFDNTIFRQLDNNSS